LPTGSGRAAPRVALTIELLGLGVAVALALIDAGNRPSETVATTAALSVLVVVGGVLGASALSNLGGDALSVVLAFATAALLYLVTEELLTEAHETEDTPLLTATFFAGFLLSCCRSLRDDRHRRRRRPACVSRVGLGEP
jgi:ZIP family zinc transporter